MYVHYIETAQSPAPGCQSNLLRLHGLITGVGKTGVIMYKRILMYSSETVQVQNTFCCFRVQIQVGGHCHTMDTVE